MAQTKHEIQALLAAADTEPRRRFGQNFMIDQNLVRLVADSASLAAGDVVIEVGPGTGTLTEELLSRGCRVIAVEIDRDLAKLLRERFAGRAEFELIEGDALAGKHALSAELLAKLRESQAKHLPVKLVANLPYNIASPLVIELLVAGVDVLAFTVQKEVAERLRASPDSGEYGPLSVMAQLLSRVEVLRTLPPQAFWPAPKIDSALVRLTRHDRLGGASVAFGEFVHALFSYRRKMLRKALAEAGYDGERILSATQADPTSRPENFAPEQLLAMFQSINTAGSPG